MNKILLFSALPMVTLRTFCQETEPSPALTKQDYLHKSKSQRTAAWTTLGGGAALLTTGFLLAYGEPDAASAFAVIGLTSTLISIPLFIASSRNKRKAAKVSTSIKFEEDVLVGQSAFTKTQFTAVAFKVNF